MNTSAIHLHWNWQMKATPEKLWPFISDANRLHKDLGWPPVQQADDSVPFKAGNEEPIEWEFPYRYGITRKYKTGAYRELRTTVDLIPNKQGTRLMYRITAIPRWNFIARLKTLNLKTLFKSRLKARLKDYDDWACRNKLPYQFSEAHTLVKGGRERLYGLKGKLITDTGQEQIVSNLIGFLVHAQDLDLHQIDPVKLAGHWRVPARNVLDVFLHAVKLGLMNFKWDLYCPRCRTIQQSCKTLNEIHEPVRCNDCGTEFNVNFNKNIQLSFYPNPLIRKISPKVYVPGGPQSRKHIKIQQYIKAGEIRYIKTKLSPGLYRLRTNLSEGTATIKVAGTGKETVNIRLTSAGLNGESVQITGEPNLIFENSTDSPLHIILERKEWNSRAITAAKATSLQLFRELFSKEVLRKGEKIAVDNLTIMFTDLLDSTGMYYKEGEEQAVGRVIEHFEILENAISEEDGAIVKTIGDSVMAVFSNPLQAFKAFSKAQEWVASDDRFDSSLRLKAGIHHGNCMAVNLNNRIDYFGSTVNIASRLVDTAEENEVILSEPVTVYDGLKSLLAQKNGQYSIKRTYTGLKGFENQKFMLNVVSLNHPTLRLVI